MRSISSARPGARSQTCGTASDRRNGAGIVRITGFRRKWPCGGARHTIWGTPIFSIGHSTRTIDEFIGLLRAHGVRTLVDIRTVPKSRHNPQFAQSALAESLAAADVEYVHIAALGGLRHPRRDSPNSGWRNESFRGYADYMTTPAFAGGLDALIELGNTRGPVAMMCAEAVPWRCHRSLVADALLVRGEQVEHIIGAGPTQVHHLNPLANVEDGQITYPPAAESS